MPIPNQAQLITYPDSLGGDLRTLRALLLRHFKGVFHGVHILPPYPSSGDRGFAPTTYFEVDPGFGTWEDVRRIGEAFDVMLDLMANHISRQSAFFKDFAQNGRASPYAGVFLTLDKIWPGGEPRQEDVAKIFLRKPGHPFSDVNIASTGQVERIWTTFGAREGSEQVDLDVHDPATQALFREILAHVSRQGVRMVRLDAIAFTIKKPGTSCFFVEPEIYDFFDWIKAQAEPLGIILLPEVHGDRSIRQKLSAHGEWIYDFALPLLVLHALTQKTSRFLKEHLHACSHRQVTMLDCHDGIPVQPDLDGILPVDESHKVVELCLDRGANPSRIFSASHRQRPGFDAHQVNVTYYSALGADDEAYLAARAIQCFTPGVPQIYYVGLLAGENDEQAIVATGEQRAINRHNYTFEEVEAALKKPAVQRLLRLIRFRNTFPAFDGDFEVLDSDDRRLELSWRNGADGCMLQVDLLAGACKISYRDKDGTTRQFKP